MVPPKGFLRLPVWLLTDANETNETTKAEERDTTEVEEGVATKTPEGVNDTKVSEVGDQRLISFRSRFDVFLGFFSSPFLSSSPQDCLFWSLPA